jgi:hypothetical protein
MSQPFLEKLQPFALSIKLLTKPRVSSHFASIINFLILLTFLCAFNTNAAKKEEAF